MILKTKNYKSIMNKFEFYKIFTSTVPGAIADGAETEIYFEELSMSGLDEMHRYSIDERFYEFMEFKPFKTKEETKKYLQKLMNRMSGEFVDRTAMYWFVRRRKDNYLIGTAGLVNLNYGRRSIEWGYGIDPELWGFGYILQLQEILKHYVFIQLELNRLEGITMIHNERTISSILASGMKQEGLIRQYYCKDGVYIDGWKYSMLKSEYLDTNKASKSDLFNNKVSIDEVVKIIEEVLQEEVDENTTMYNSMSWDSINHMQIIVKLYKKFNIEFSPIQISNATTVKSITTLINNL